MPIPYGMPADVGPFRDVVPVTPTDGVDLPSGPSRGLLVGTAGNISGLPVGSGTTVRTFPVQVGWNPICMRQINSTNTTAAGIHACY